MTFDPALAVKRPDCWNRPEPTDPNVGWRNTRAETRRDSRGTWVRKQVYRYRHPWFEFRCTVHDKADIGPGLTYAEFHGWIDHCKTCSWYPKEAQA
jgi:hypothetical protein